MFFLHRKTKKHLTKPGSLQIFSDAFNHLYHYRPLRVSAREQTFLTDKYNKYNKYNGTDLPMIALKNKSIGRSRVKFQ